MLAGYPYVADEITAVSPDDLTVLPYHRPIGLRRGGAGAVGVEYPSVPDDRYSVVYPWEVGDSLALSSGGRLAGIVLVSWGADADPVVADVRPAQAMVELTEHTMVDGDAFESPFGDLQRIVRAVPVVRLAYSTTAESLDLLSALVDRWSELRQDSR